MKKLLSRFAASERAAAAYDEPKIGKKFLRLPTCVAIPCAPIAGNPYAIVWCAATYCRTDGMHVKTERTPPELAHACVGEERTPASAHMPMP